MAAELGSGGLGGLAPVRVLYAILQLAITVGRYTELSRNTVWFSS